MIDRYSHPTVADLYSDVGTLRLWHEIEYQTLAAQRDLGIVPTSETDTMVAAMAAASKDQWNQVGLETAGLVHFIEQRTKHDVAAFLEYLRGEFSPDETKWLHFGLTSSDVVDTAQGMRFRVLRLPLFQMLDDGLLLKLEHLAEDDTPLLGRTHGLPAEPTAMKVRARHWIACLEGPVEALHTATEAMQLAKLSGPVGTFAHNPPMVERRVAEALGLTWMGQGASQVVPRSGLALWASAAAAVLAACSKIATDLRLMLMLGEVTWPVVMGTVGSSAMPQKTGNPVLLEKVSGLARMAAGYAAMLQPQDIWLEQDMSHSCVERVAVPDLWHILFHGVLTTINRLRRMELTEHAQDSVRIHANEAYAAKTALDQIRQGSSYVEARQFAVTMPDSTQPPSWFVRNYEDTV